MVTQTAASIADDYLQWEDTETVSLISVAHGGADDTTVTNITAKPLRIRRSDFEILANLGIEDETRTWLMPDTLLDSNRPKSGDVIVRADSTRWIIRTAEQIVHDTVWRCLTTKEPS